MRTKTLSTITVEVMPVARLAGEATNGYAGNSANSGTGVCNGGGGGGCHIRRTLGGTSN